MLIHIGRAWNSLTSSIFEKCFRLDIPAGMEHAKNDDLVIHEPIEDPVLSVGVAPHQFTEIAASCADLRVVGQRDQRTPELSSIIRRLLTSPLFARIRANACEVAPRPKREAQSRLTGRHQGLALSP